MALAKFQENRFRNDGEIAENHAILVNLTMSIVISHHSHLNETSRIIVISHHSHLAPVAL